MRIGTVVRKQIATILKASRCLWRFAVQRLSVRAVLQHAALPTDKCPAPLTFVLWQVCGCMRRRVCLLIVALQSLSG